MPDKKGRKPLYEPVIPAPTQDDLAWAKRVDKWGFARAKAKLKDIVDNNQIWRLNFLHEKYKDKLDLSYRYNRFSGSCSSESLLGRAIEAGYEDMGLLLSNYKAIARNCDSLWSCTIKKDSAKMAYALLQYSQSQKFYNFRRALGSGAYKVAQVFIELGEVKYNNENLMRVVSFGSLNAVEFFVEGGADITANDYAVIKKAHSDESFEIEGYLKEKAGLLENETLALPAPVQESGSDLYEKLSDVELLKTSVSQSGNMTLTSIFNFEMKDIIRTQYIGVEKQSETRCNFKDLEDVQSIRPMFEKLQNLGGNPPSDIFKAVRRVKIVSTGKGGHNVKNK